MIKQKKKCIVVGAGIAGLTLSYKLAHAGHDVILVEKGDRVGGLAKSFHYAGGYIFDAGPHRFFTLNQSVSDFIQDVIAHDFFTIKRKSGVRMFSRYFDWPLTMRAVFQMPSAVLISAARDFFREKRQDGASFEDYILSKYGTTLYRFFFKPYTEKFLGIPCTGISREWAVTGIDRAIIHNVTEINSLSSLARSLVSRQSPLEFIYPKGGGIGIFSEKLRRKFIDCHGTLLLGAQITGISASNGIIDGVVIGDHHYGCDLLVWTGSITDLSVLLGIDPAGLEYLNMLIYNYCMDSPTRCQYQWCYFGSSDVPFNRISIPALFDPSLSPFNRGSVCVEVTCRPNDSTWISPENVDKSIRKALMDNSIIRTDQQVLACHIERITNAYPIYTLDYYDKLQGILSHLRRFANLKLLGRTGTFWYNNMDQSIEAALSLFGEICRDQG